MHQQSALRLALPALVLLAGTVLSSPSNPIYRSVSPEHIRLVDRAVRPSRAELEAECGDLGVMEVPEGENPLEYRHCLNHPSSIDPTAQSFAARDVSASAELMACLRNPGSRGCSTSNTNTMYYCWRACGTKAQIDKGYWCWLAWNGGKGDWVRCGSEADHTNCQVAMNNGASCGQGSCSSCGCSC